MKVSHRLPTPDAAIFQQRLQVICSPQVTEGTDESWNEIQSWMDRVECKITQKVKYCQLKTLDLKKDI